ncbi:MAG TPA: chemotaxis protein CheD [Candidatus Angelobacter sp.]|nr:chemotaxis protein CheD [Candidatus Angelobacter sp.]
MKLSSGMDTLKLKHPPESKPSTVYLHPGQSFVSQSPRQITTIVGSCVAVLLWSSRFRIGGATHYLLPEWNREGEPSTRYGDIALEGLLKEMTRLGASVFDLRAYIYGGASILESLQGLSGNLGTRNVEVALEWLRNHPQITLVDCKTGGKKGRKICFDTFEGTATLYEIG